MISHSFPSHFKLNLLYLVPIFTPFCQLLSDDNFTSVDSSTFSFYNLTNETAATYQAVSWPTTIKKYPDTTPIIYQCGNKSLLGGPQIFGPGENISLIEVTYNGTFPSHCAYQYQMKIYNFDTDPKQEVMVMASPVSRTFISIAESPVDTTNYCGNTVINMAEFTGYVATTNSSIFIVSVNSTPLPTSFGYFGFREIQIFLQLCDPTCAVCTLSLSCTTCVANAIKYSTTTCQCPSGYYWQYCPTSQPCNYQCLKCPTYCTTCASANNCLTCVSTYFLTLQGSCVSSCPLNTYISGTTCQNCDPSCRSCSGPTIYECLTCPPNIVLYKGECLSSCPNQTFNSTTKINSYNQILCIDCDSTCLTCSGPYNTQCTSCFDPNNYLSDSTCINYCPAGQYSYTEEMICLQCYTGCLSCFGPDENQCMTCSGTNSIINDNSCVSQCPSDKYPITYLSSQITICESCGLYCAVCNQINQCGECQEGYFFDQSQGSCKLSQQLAAYIVEVMNPTKFYLFFSSSWGYIQENYQNIISLALYNASDISFNYQIINSMIYSNAYLISLTYNDTIPSTASLIISITINYALTDYQYKLKDNSTQITIPLQEYPFCSSSQYYDETSNLTLNKIIISPELAYGSDSITFSLSFNSINNLQSFVSVYSTIMITSFLSTDFNYTLTPTSSTSTTFTLQLNPYKPVVLLPIMQYSLILPEEIVILNDYANSTSTASIILHDYYLLNNEENAQIEAIKGQNDGASDAAQGSACFGTIVSSGSPLFIQGMMLSQMIFLMKFTKIEFPPNLVELFKENDLPTFFFFYTFEMDSEDEGVLPEGSIKDDVSPYYMNNVGEMICKNAVLLFIAIIFIIICEHFKKYNNNILMKSFTVARGVIVFELVLFFYLENLLKMGFLTTVSLMYPAINSSQGKLNYSISACAIVIGGLFLLHIYFVIKNCQTLKMNEAFEKHKLSIFMKGSSKYGSTSIKGDRKTRVFDENFFGNKELRLEKSSVVNNFTLNPKNKEESSGKDSKEATDLPLSPLSPIHFFPLGSPSLLEKTQDNPNKNNTKVCFGQMELKDTGNSSPEEPFTKEKTKIETINILKSMKSFSIASPLPQKFRKTFDMFESESKPSMILTKITKFEEPKKCLDHQPWKFLYRPNPKDPEQYLKDHLLLHEEIKNDKYVRYFVLLDYLRQTTICILIALMRSQPLAQLILINLINVVFLTMTAIYRPFIKCSSLFFELVNELITAVALIGVLGLAIMDKLENGDTRTRLNLGWVIIYANLGLLYWIILNCIMSVVLKLCEKFRFRGKVFVD